MGNPVQGRTAIFTMPLSRATQPSPWPLRRHVPVVDPELKKQPSKEVQLVLQVLAHSFLTPFVQRKTRELRLWQILAVLPYVLGPLFVRQDS